jgi:DNA modification methylase
LINRICQMRDWYIINQIIWVMRNSRPNVATMALQPSHHCILWIGKEKGNYRFNYRQCKRSEFDGDYFAARGLQLRDVWDIPAAPHENKPYGHPSPKPLAVYRRCLDVAGKPDGLLLDLFAGSGTGAIAAMRWGMHSLSIEREPTYCELIRRRVAAEVAGGSD